MQRYALALCMICAMAVYAILMLRPDTAVELEAELARMEPKSALARLAELSDDIAFTENLHLTHARLAAGAGDFETAEVAYGKVIEIGGAAPDVLDELADIAALSGNLLKAADFKAQAETLEPKAERRQTLGYWYRLLGDEAGEERLLSETPPHRLSTFERERLAGLYLASGDVEHYRSMLVTLSESGGDDEVAARRQLLELEIEAGKLDTALALARDWFAAAPEDRGGLEASLRTLVGRGALDQADALATYAIETDPEVGAVPVTVFISTGHGGIGRGMQMNWLARDGSLDAEDWDALVRVAEQSGDLTGLRTAIARAAVAPFDGQGDAPPPATAFLQFLRYQGARALIPYESTMTSETFEEVPLIGAAWHGWLRQPKESFDYLLAAANGPLTDWDRAIWMLIAYDLRSTTFYRDLLAGAPADAGLRDLLSLSIRSPMPTPPLGEQSAPTGD